MSAPYFDLIREMRDAYNHRLRLVESARQDGIKPTARLFQTTVVTRTQVAASLHPAGLFGLPEQSRAPLHQPRKAPADFEQQLLQLRQTLPTFGARRLIRDFDLPISHRALERICRPHGLMPKRRRK